MSEEPERLDPSEAFSLVASETRFDVLQSLWDLTEGAGGRSVSFAELRRASDLRDSGQFNYHLDQLTPQFVRKVEDGYQLTAAGRQIIGAAVSGVYTDQAQSMASRTVGDCPQCGGPIEALYEHGLMHIHCGDCGLHLSDAPAPPVLVGTHDPANLPGVLGKYLLIEIQRLNRGFCINCGGPLEASIEPRERDAFDDWNVEFTCQACGGKSASHVTGAVADHPAVVALLYESGIDYRETPVWELEAILSATETVRSEDPIRVETTFSTDDATLTLTVDENLDVVECVRREHA